MLALMCKSHASIDSGVLSLRRRSRRASPSLMHSLERSGVVDAAAAADEVVAAAAGADAADGVAVDEAAADAEAAVAAAAGVVAAGCVAVDDADVEDETRQPSPRASFAITSDSEIDARKVSLSTWACECVSWQSDSESSLVESY